MARNGDGRDERRRPVSRVPSVARGRQVLVFASHDSAQWTDARALADAVNARLVDRLGGLDEVLLVAEHKVVEPVVVLALSDGVVVLRIPRLPTAEELKRDLQFLT